MTELSPLSPSMVAFLAAPRFAVLASLDPGGGPRQAVAWYRLESDGTLVVNSAAGRRWPANLRRDGRVALAVMSGIDGYSWLGLTGVVTEVIDDQATAQADIAGLARRYHADDPAEAERMIATVFGRQLRVSFRIRVTGVHDHMGG
jgi:PPOX class probable F420-dependent enzyme